VTKVETENLKDSPPNQGKRSKRVGIALKKKQKRSSEEGGERRKKPGMTKWGGHPVKKKRAGKPSLGEKAPKKGHRGSKVGKKRKGGIKKRETRESGSARGAKEIKGRGRGGTNREGLRDADNVDSKKIIEKNERE